MKERSVGLSLCVCLCLCLAALARANTDRGLVLYQETIEEELPVGSTVLQLNSSKFIRQIRILESMLSNMTGQSVTLSNIRFRGTLLRDEFRFDGPTLRVASRLDREAICELPELNRACPCSGTCQYVIEYKAEAHQQLVAIKVLLNITDINDHEPVFLEGGRVVNETELRIPENSKKTSFQLSPCAEDADSRFGLRSYQLINASSGFRLSPASVGARCPVRVDVTVPLDREAAQHHSFTVIAVDHGAPSRTGTLRVDVVVLDENDHAPQFSSPSFNVSIREDFYPEKSELLRVEATDADENDNGAVSYRFDRPHEHFAIDPISGQISVIKQLDFETRRVHQLRVIAEDAARELRMSATAIVDVQLVDINDSPPDITLYDADQSQRDPEYLTVTENDQPRAAGYLAVYDPDFLGRQNVSCSIERSTYYSDSSASSLFQLDAVETQQSGLVSFRIQQIAPIDREAVGNDISLTVICIDQLDSNRYLQARKEIRVKVVDVNDNPPRFDRNEFYAEIRENNEPNEFIAKLDFSDADQYATPARFDVIQLLPNRTDKLAAIRVDADGRVYATQRFDREQCAFYRFQVTVTDASHPSANETAILNLVIRDENDCVPQFDRTEYEFEQPEETFNQPSHYIGKLTVTDCDSDENGRVSLTLSLEGEPQLASNSPFAIINGDIHAMRAVDREQQPVYSLIVRAVDHGEPQRTATARVTIRVLDRNDKSPVFTEPSFSANVSVHAPAGSRVTQISANDGDEPGSVNARVRYAFHEYAQINQCSALLTLDSETGEVRLSRSFSQSQYSDSKTLRCLIEAMDGGSPPRTAHVQLTVTFSDRFTFDTADASAPRPAGSFGGSGATGASKDIEEGYERFVVLLIASISVVVLTVLSLTVLLLLLRKYRYASRSRKRGSSLNTSATRRPALQRTIIRAHMPTADDEDPDVDGDVEDERQYGTIPSSSLRKKLATFNALQPTASCQLCVVSDAPRNVQTFRAVAADDYKLLRLGDTPYDNADCFAQTPSVTSEEKRASMCSCDSGADENDNERERARSRLGANSRCASRAGPHETHTVPRSTSYTNPDSEMLRHTVVAQAGRADSRCLSALDRNMRLRDRERERDRDIPQYAVLTLPHAENTFV